MVWPTLGSGTAKGQNNGPGSWPKQPPDNTYIRTDVTRMHPVAASSMQFSRRDLQERHAKHQLQNEVALTDPTV